MAKKKLSELIKKLTKKEKKENLKKKKLEVKEKPQEELQKPESIEKKVEEPEEQDEKTLDTSVKSETKKKKKKETQFTQTDAYFAMFRKGDGGYNGPDSNYIQQKISAYNGFMHVSNIKQNYDMVNSTAILNHENRFKEDIVDQQLVEHYAKQTIINSMTGSFMYQDVSMEEKVRMNHWILNDTNKTKYLATATLLGFGQDMLGATVKRITDMK